MSDRYTDTSQTAAPQVAGLIATYLAYDKKPWDDTKTGMNRVREIRRYITSKASSWERKQGINVIWNGATEEDHKSAGANGLSNAPPPQAAPPPAQKTKALSIIFQKSRTNSGGGIFNTYDWLFFATDRGVSKLCEDMKKAKHKVSDTKDEPAGNGVPP